MKQSMPSQSHLYPRVRCERIFHLPRIGVRGEAHWMVLDERGVPEVPRNPSGFAIASAEGVRQSNLITDQGLDVFATPGSEDSTAGARSILTSSGLRAFLHVGTGSTAPAEADTTLDNEVQRAASNGGFGDGSRSIAFVDAEKLHRETILVRRAVTMTADRNLTEFGFSHANNADVNIRELFRDSGGTPVTISLLDGKIIRVDHTLFLEIPAPDGGIAGQFDLEEYDVGNNLIGSTTYDYFMAARCNYAGGFQTRMFASCNPATTGNQRPHIGVLNQSQGTQQDTFPSNILNANYNSSRGSWDAYSLGSYESVIRHTFTPAEANGTKHGLVMTTSGGMAGFMAVLDDPATFDKVDTDELRIALKVSWGRL